MIIIVGGTVGLGVVFAIIFILLIVQQSGGALAPKIASFVTDNKLTIWIITLAFALAAAVLVWRFFKKRVSALLCGVNIAHLGLCTINFLSNAGRTTGFDFWFTIIVGFVFYMADIIITGFVMGFDICVEKYPIVLIIGTAVGWIFAYTFW